MLCKLNIKNHLDMTVLPLKSCDKVFEPINTPLPPLSNYEGQFGHYILTGRRSGLVIESRTREREVGGSILTQVPLLCPSARYIYLPKSTGNTQEAVAPSRHD